MGMAPTTAPDIDPFVLKTAIELEREMGYVRPQSFIPIVPHPKQKLFLDLDDTKEALFGGATGGGKLLSLDTPIPTPSGWATMGTIREGDYVLAPDGLPCRVSGVYAIETPERAYQLTFDDGSTIIAGGEHQWVTFDARERVALTRRSPKFRAKRRTARASRASGTKSLRFTTSLTLRNQTVLRPPTLPAPTGTVRNTDEIYASTYVNGRVNHSIEVTKETNLSDVDLPIDPYCLGAWLGDGHSSGGGFTSVDPQIWEQFEINGYEVTHNPRTAQAHYVKGLVPQLRKLGLLNNKHVPAIYLRSGADQRLALLQGLMDTDGYAAKSGSVQFCNTNRALVDAVYEIIVSLGWKARVIPKIPMLNGKPCAAAYQIKWTPNRYVFRLERKRQRQKFAERLTTRMRYIVECRPVDPVPMRCISVDHPRRMYLVGKSFIPTHNTISLLADALKYVAVPDYSALLLRTSYPDLKQEGGLIDVAHTWLQQTSAKWNEQDHTWTFPSRATLRFGFLATENDKYRYQGGEYQYIGFDELTQFRESQYRYLFSRLRKKAGMRDVPLRMRGATNPGGVGGQWVYERFIPERFTPDQARELKVWFKEHENGHKTAFVPSLLDDNPSLDRQSYLESLAELDEITRQQYLSGDWLIQVRGDILYTYSEPHTVITWSQFEEVFGTRHIPNHWRLSVYQDFGTTPDHPCVTSWFATAAENGPLPGQVFLYRGLTLTQCTAADVADEITRAMAPHGEVSRTTRWQMSHEASSERLEYIRRGLPFRNWPTGKTRGIEQLKNAFALQSTDTPHPFKPGLMGCPKLLLIVDDDEAVYAKTDAGLVRHRAEIPAYHTNTLKSGDVMTRWEPYPLFNDAIDTMRAAAVDYFPVMEGLTKEELIEKHIQPEWKQDARAKRAYRMEDELSLLFARKEAAKIADKIDEGIKTFSLYED